MTNGPSDSSRPPLFTTHKALAVMEKLKAGQNQSDAQTTYEPCCGSGGFLMIAAQQVSALFVGSDNSTERTIDMLLTNPPFSNS